MLTEKANAICLLEVLKEYSDAEHILPMREIIAKMQSLYGIKIDRRTVYGAVALLIELGYDISLYEDNGVGYYLRERELEPSEVLLLTDAVYSFQFIPARQTEHNRSAGAGKHSETGLQCPAPFGEVSHRYYRGTVCRRQAVCVSDHGLLQRRDRRARDAGQ